MRRTDRAGVVRKAPASLWCVPRPIRSLAPARSIVSIRRSTPIWSAIFRRRSVGSRQKMPRLPRSAAPFRRRNPPHPSALLALLPPFCRDRPISAAERLASCRGAYPMRRGIRSTRSANTDCFCARLRSGPAADDGAGTERRRLPVMTLQRLLRAERRLDRFGRGRDTPGDAHPLNALLAGTGGRDGDVPSLWRDAAPGAGVQLSLAHREGASARELCAVPGGTSAPFAAGGADVQPIRQ